MVTRGDEAPTQRGDTGTIRRRMRMRGHVRMEAQRERTLPPC